MRVRFWGTRGSLPVSATADTVTAKICDALVAASGRTFADVAEARAFAEGELPFAVHGTYGGHTSCVQIEPGDSITDHVLCDLGSGLRPFSQRQLESGKASGETYHLFLSHPHWDHIMGFPFFVPAYIPGNTVRIYACHDNIEYVLRTQQSQPWFPVDFGNLGADIEFVTLTPDEPYEIAGMTVRATQQEHSGESYGYRFQRDGKSIVYSTDAEHKLESDDVTDRFVEFIRDTDLVIFDSMYSLADAISIKEDWGHSSNIVGVDLCHRAHVGRYCMFHHEPIYDDAAIARVLGETIRYEELMREDWPLEVISAYDGLVVEV
jgi:phosphoribosyl 1,2-cyclic phosphodiesterase